MESQPTHLEVAGLRKLGNPEGFKFYRYEVLDDESFLLTGCVPSGTYTRGPRKGRPKYDGPARRVTVNHAELKAERARYEAETGLCWDCRGEKRVVNGWTRVEGTTYVPCRECDSTGKPKASA